MLIKLIGLEFKKLGKLKMAVVLLVLTLPLLYIHIIYNGHILGARAIYEEYVEPKYEFYDDIRGELTEDKYNYLNEKLMEITDGEGYKEQIIDENGNLVGEATTDLLANFYKDAIDKCDELIGLEKNRQLIMANVEKRLKNNDKLDTYTIRYSEKVLEQAKNLSYPKLSGSNNFYFVFDWDGYIFYIIPAVIIILCSSFSKENESGMEMLMKSSKVGRKKTFIAKHIVMLSVCAMVTIYFHMVVLAGVLYTSNGLKDITYPIRSSVMGYEYTLYDFNILEYFLVITLIRTIAVAALASIILLVSMVSKKTSVSIGASIGIVGGLVGITYYIRATALDFFDENFSIIRLSNDLSEKLFTYGLFPADYFKEYELTNVFGYPVESWMVIAFWGVITSIIIMTISWNIYCGKPWRRRKAK